MLVLCVFSPIFNRILCLGPKKASAKESGEKKKKMIAMEMKREIIEKRDDPGRRGSGIQFARAFPK